MVESHQKDASINKPWIVQISIETCGHTSMCRYAQMNKNCINFIDEAAFLKIKIQSAGWNYKLDSTYLSTILTGIYLYSCLSRIYHEISDWLRIKSVTIW